MRKDTLLLMVIAIGSGLCWWPAFIEPGIGFSVWIPLVIVALLIVLATALSEEGWLRQVVACVVGTFVGLCAGFIVLPFTDSIGHSYMPFDTALFKNIPLKENFKLQLRGKRTTRLTIPSSTV